MTRKRLDAFVLGNGDEFGEESFSGAQSASVSVERRQSLELDVVRCQLEQARQRLGVGSAPAAPATTHHVAGAGGGRRAEQVVDDVGRRQRLMELTQEYVDVQTALAVQQVDLTRKVRTVAAAAAK